MSKASVIVAEENFLFKKKSPGHKGTRAFILERRMISMVKKKGQNLRRANFK
jgi:hypothetical protein